ncbi:MAG: divergent polysaccharide deacetylase family protein [Bacteroides sp.]|nr:divergent polysaccharide deacetylase family protein [Prevotella sp.]MCM1408028.1 divergent polysaccharide deacetylase family protein [Treponema brennaborense]MCM1469004.1 divergent polysaccharide deacetylase family protein [Bacteroides sp.]
MAQKKRSKNNVKRLKISPGKTILLSAAVFALCVCMLIASIFISSPRGTKQTSAANERNTESTAPVKLPQQDREPAEKQPPQKASDAEPQPSAAQKTAKQKTASADAPEPPQKHEKPLPEKKQISAPAKKTAPDEIPAAPEKKAAAPDRKIPKSETPAVPLPPKQPAGSKGTVVLIFDDGGNNLGHLEPYLAIPFPVTIAVLPGLAASVQTAQKVRNAGKEVMLHQPMQAVDLSINPGPGAVTPEMNEIEIRQVILDNLSEIGPVSGMNNHEGSLITGELWAIGTVLDICMEQNLYFVDSRTSVASKAREAAAARGMKIWERSIFIDNSPQKEDMLAEIKKGLAAAEKNGFVIMIGHVRPHGLAQLVAEKYPEWERSGYAFKTISQLK